MKNADVFKMVWASWRLNKNKARLSIAVVAFIVFVVLMIVTLGFGLAEATLGRLAQQGVLNSIDVSSPNPDSAPLTDTVVERLKLIENVAYVAPSVDYASIAKFGTATTDANVTAATGEFFANELPVMLAGTSAFSSGEASEVVVSSALVKALGYSEPGEAVGQTIDFSISVPDYNQLGGDRIAVPELLFNNIEKQVEVVGVTNETQYSLAFIPLDILGLQDKYYSVIRLVTKNQSDVARVRLSVEELGYQAVTYGDTFSDAQTIFNLARIAFIVMGAIALLILSIVAAETMTISLLENASQVAVMKRLGMDDKQVHRLYVAEALSFVVLGSAIGVIATFAVGWLINGVVYMLARDQGAEGILLFHMPLYLAPLVLTTTAVIGLVAGLFPARRAVRMRAVTK
ncbi:MAG TPA: ABC transporter permease [bacterium]|jgi:putative ABC transport system permease protein|nr:ABC transporter permease [bacterium]